MEQRLVIFVAKNNSKLAFVCGDEAHEKGSRLTPLNNRAISLICIPGKLICKTPIYQSSNLDSKEQTDSSCDLHSATDYRKDTCSPGSAAFKCCGHEGFK